jgi:hypothetical protein
MSDIKVGDRVEITRYRRYDDEFVGQTGIVTRVDTGADVIAMAAFLAGE